MWRLGLRALRVGIIVMEQNQDDLTETWDSLQKWALNK